MVTKKSGLIVIVVLLALARLASAGLVFTVDGEALPDESEIVLYPSDVIELDLELAEGHSILGYFLGYTLTNSGAEFITDFIEFPAVFDLSGHVVVEEPQYVEIAAASMLMPTPGPTVLMQNLRVHQLDLTPVDLIVKVQGGTMIDGEWLEVGTVLHTLHIVPEPATLLLLGLGGLFLRNIELNNPATPC